MLGSCPKEAFNVGKGPPLGKGGMHGWGKKGNGGKVPGWGGKKHLVGGVEPGGTQGERSTKERGGTHGSGGGGPGGAVCSSVPCGTNWGGGEKAPTVSWVYQEMLKNQPQNDPTAHHRKCIWASLPSPAEKRVKPRWVYKGWFGGGGQQFPKKKQKTIPSVSLNL